jgi:hypothetical protein
MKFTIESNANPSAQPKYFSQFVSDDRAKIAKSDMRTAPMNFGRPGKNRQMRCEFGRGKSAACGEPLRRAYRP